MRGNGNLMSSLSLSIIKQQLKHSRKILAVKQFDNGRLKVNWAL
jgi:hypothetical protein